MPNKEVTVKFSAEVSPARRFILVFLIAIIQFVCLIGWAFYELAIRLFRVKVVVE